jgi:uncharacterized protein
MIKILAFADMHGSISAFRKIKKKAKEAELIVCAGDISLFGRDLQKLFEKFNSLNLPMIVIPGNHEDEKDIRKHSKKFENIIPLQDQIHSIGQYHFLCAEGNGFAHEDPRFKRISELFTEEVRKLRKDSDNKFILVTHAPPHKTHLDKVMDGHSGNKAIRRFIHNAQPDHAICGHIHENAGKSDKIGKTRIINPGPFGALIIIK